MIQWPLFFSVLTALVAIGGLILAADVLSDKPKPLRFAVATGLGLTIMMLGVWHGYVRGLGGRDEPRSASPTTPEITIEAPALIVCPADTEDPTYILVTQ